MSRFHRADIPGDTYFFSVVSYRRRQLLCDDLLRTALRDAVRPLQYRHPFTLDAWGLLPAQRRCIRTLSLGDADFAMRWGLIKRMVSLASA